MFCNFNILLLFRWFEWHHVLVMYSRWDSIPGPDCCTADITDGQAEGSNKNWVKILSASGPVTSVNCLTRGRSRGLSDMSADQWDMELVLVSNISGQLTSWCWSVPGVGGLPDTRHSWQFPSGFLTDQCLDLWSDTYLPDNMVATVAALDTSNGVSARVHMG